VSLSSSSFDCRKYRIALELIFFCKQKRISTSLIIQRWGFYVGAFPSDISILCVIVSLDQLYVFMVDVAHEIDFASA